MPPSCPIIFKLIVPSCQSLGQWAVSSATSLHAPRNDGQAYHAIKSTQLLTRLYFVPDHMLHLASFSVSIQSLFGCFAPLLDVCDHTSGRPATRQIMVSEKNAEIKQNNAHECVIYTYKGMYQQKLRLDCFIVFFFLMIRFGSTFNALLA